MIFHKVNKMVELAINNDEYRRAIEALAAFASNLTWQEWQETRENQILLCEDEDAWRQPENLLVRMAGTMVGEVELRFQWRLRYTKRLNVGVIGALRDESAAVVMIMDDVEKFLGDRAA
jgi:hypothetical protein